MSPQDPLTIVSSDDHRDILVERQADETRPSENE